MAAAGVAEVTLSCSAHMACAVKGTLSHVAATLLPGDRSVTPFLLCTGAVSDRSALPNFTVRRSGHDPSDTRRQCQDNFVSRIKNAYNLCPALPWATSTRHALLFYP